MRKGNFTHIGLQVNSNDIYLCKSIEREVEIAETTKTPIEATAPTIFTERKDGVLPQYDIRTDRWKIAQRAMDKVAASYEAKRADWIKLNSDDKSAEVSA